MRPMLITRPVEKLLSRIGLDYLIAFSLGLGSFVLYLRTLAPTILAADSGEFQFASYVLGLVHPTGYPLYLLLAKLFTLLPFGDAAYRVNLMSAFWAACTIGVLYLVNLRVMRLSNDVGAGLKPAPTGPDHGSSQIRQNTIPRICAAIATVAFAVSETFWSQAVIAEVYTLNTFFVALTLLLLLRWRSRIPDTPEKKPLEAYPLVFVGLLGLSLTHHHSMLLLLPVYALYFWLTRSPLWRKNLSVIGWRRLGLLVATFALPMLLYLYIPLRAPQSTYLTLDLGAGQKLTLYTNDFSGFVDMISGRVFGSKLQASSENTLEKRARYYVDLAVKQFGFPSVVLGVVGAYWLLRRRREVFILLAGIYLVTVAFGLIYQIGDIFVYFIPSHMILATSIGVGVYCLIALVSPAARRGYTTVEVGLKPAPTGSAGGSASSEPADVEILEISHFGRAISPNTTRRQAFRLFRACLAGALAALAFAFIGSVLLSNYARVDMSQARGIRERWEQILADAPQQGALLISDDRDDMVPLWYMQQVEKRRTDLVALFPGIVDSPDYANVVRLIETVRHQSDKSIYLIKPMDGLQVKYDIRPEKSLFRVDGDASVRTTLRTVQADFAGLLRLADYSWSPVNQSAKEVSVVRAGEGIEIDLRWKVLASEVKEDYQTFVHVVDDQGKAVAQSDLTPGGVFYPSSRWVKDEVLLDAHALIMPADLPSGFYELRAGVYNAASMTNLKTKQGEGSVVIGRIFVQPAGTASPPQRPVDTTFDRSITLLGYDLGMEATTSNGGKPTFKAGQPLKLVLQWRGASEIAADYTVFVHVSDQPGRVVAQSDGMPQLGKAPTSEWPLGETIKDPRSIDLPTDMAPGTYSVIAGLYDAKTGQRLVTDAGADSVQLLQFEAVR